MPYTFGRGGRRCARRVCGNCRIHTYILKSLSYCSYFLYSSVAIRKSYTRVLAGMQYALAAGNETKPVVAQGVSMFGQLQKGTSGVH